MPVIPFSSASRITEIDRETQEQRDAEEARRYRELADAKLKELMNTPVKRFDPQGGTSPIDVPEPVTGGWRVRTNGDPQPNGDALPGGAFNRMGAPDIDDPMRDEQGFGGPDNWTPELAMPASPEGESFVGMGSGGPEQPVGDGGLSEDQIANIRDRFRKRKEGDSTRELRARMLSAPNADQAAIDADLAERQGVNRLEVERNRDTFVAVDRAQAIDDLRKTAPKLRAWLDYNPANLEVAHDDVESLGWWEQTAAFFSPGNLSIDKVGQALQSGFVDKIPEQLYGLDQMLGDANASIYKALPDWFPGKFGLVNEQVQRSLMADMKRQEMAAQGKANAPVGETWLERGIYGVAQSAPSTLVSLAITAVTRSPVVGSGSMGATTAGGAYGEARDEGKSLGDAFRYALTQGGIEAGTEFLPAKFLLKDLATDAPFLKTFTRNAVNEGMGEQVATFTGDLDRWLTLNPEGTIAEFFAERPNAALETLVASTIMSGVTTTVAKGMQAAGDQLDQSAKQKRAELLGKTFDAMAQNAKDSKLLKRLPEKYRELVNQVTKDGPLENVRIAPEAIVSLAQEEGVTVEQIAQAFRIDPNEMVTAMDAGEDVVIPAGNYAAGIAGAKKAIGVSGEEMHAAFAPNMRLRADDFTANEMAAMKSVMEAEQKARTEGGDAEQSFADAADRVRNTIREAVTATGLFNADAANTQAELVGSIVTTLAERTGQDPEALWKERGFDIVAALNGETSTPDSLPQSVTTDENAKEIRGALWNYESADPKDLAVFLGMKSSASPDEIRAEAARVYNEAKQIGLAEAKARQAAKLAETAKEIRSMRERGVDDRIIARNLGLEDGAMDRIVQSQDARDSLAQSLPDDATPTQRLIDMRAKGMGNAEIAAELYPDVDAKTATNRVKALASKHKAKIEERRAALEGAKSLAATEAGAAPSGELAQFGGSYGANALALSGEPRVAQAMSAAIKMDAAGASREEIWSATADMLRGTKFIGVFKGADGRWRFEIDDSDVALKSDRPKSGVLGDYLTNADAGGAYPALADMPTEASFSIFSRGGSFGWDGIKAKSDNLRSTLLHEGQHAIQEIELFAPGGPSRDADYRWLAGEVEARNVQFRRDFTANERRARPPWITQDVIDQKQIAVLTGSEPNLLAQGEQLEQTQRGTFTPREDRNVIRLFESANLSTLAHEGSHWYLDTLWRMSKTENPHPFVLEQLAAVLEWHGKSPNWDAMFNPDGSFTKEGVDLQEAFAESFEAYLMEGKAPTTALRSVFASFKQWLLSIYKGIAARIGGRARLNDEIRSVFDRMLATDEAIKAVHTGLARDGEAMAKAILDKQDPDGKWKPERREKFMERMRERYAAARERAEAALMARLMDEFQRTKQAAWRDEERQVKREVEAEVDARPEQRAFAWLAGAGWRETAEDRLANEAATEAEAMLALAQADGYVGSSYQEAAEWISAREKGLDMSDEARAKRAKEMGFTKRFYHETQADPEALNEGFDTTRRQAAAGDSVMPLGVFVKPGAGGIGIGGTQVELLVRLGNNRVFADRAELEAHLRQDAEYARMADELAAIDVRYKAEFAALEKEWDQTERRSPEWRQRSDNLNVVLREWEGAMNVAGEAARVRATEVLKAEGLNSITVTKDEGSFKRAIKTTVVFNPNDLRSPNAAFDPDKSDSARLLAQGDGDWMGAFLDNYVENPSQRSIERMMRKLFATGIPPAIRLLRYDGKVIAFDGFNYSHDDAIQLLGAPRDAARGLIERGDTLETVRWYDDIGSTLAQTVQPSRQLDAMGFYSAAQEAAQRVPDGIWQMGWQAARNSLAKGRDGIVPRKTEIEYLGLDAMFGDTKLKGAALKDAVLEHIAAKRLSLVENFARFDPNSMKTPTKRVMLKEMDDYALADAIGLYLRPMGEGRVSIETDIGEDKSNLYLQRTTGALSGPSYYDLIRYYDGGKKEVLANGVEGDLRGKIARLIVDENFAKAERNIKAEALADEWRASIENNLVRGPGDIRLPGEDVPLFEAVIGLPEGVPGSDYRAPSSHVGGKAKGTLVTAHGEERIDDKGQRTVFVGQVQSDMAQQARELKVEQEANKRSLELIIERSGIVDRATAAAWMKSTGATDAGIAELNDADLMGLARQNWAAMRGGYSYQYHRHEFLREQDSNSLKALDAPLLSTSEWTNVAVRSMLYRAAREGFQSISFPTAETSEIIQGNDTAAQHYETNVKGALEKLAKQLGGEVRKGLVDYDTDAGGTYPHFDVYDANGRKAFRYASREGAELAIKRGEGVEIREGSVTEPPSGPAASAYILDITPAMRAKIMSEGFPLFQTGDDKGRATPPPNLPPMRLNLQAVKEQYGEQALAEIPPDVAAYSAEANDVEAYVQIARDVRKTLNETPPKSLWKFLSTARNIGQGEGRISYRGIRDTDGELLKIIGEKKAARGLIADPTKDSKRSRSYDMQQAIEAAWEAGYFDGEDLPTPAQFLDTLRADIDGQAPRYRRDDIPTVSTIAGAERWKDWFDQNDMDITSDVATLRAKLATVLTGQGTSAIGPDEAAEVFNGVIGTNAFPTGFDLLKALKQGPLRDKLIRDLTEQRMIERNGDVFRDGTIMQEAEAYARNEVQHRQFEIELEALAEAAGKGTAGALAKQTAIENLRSKQVREVLNYTQWLTLERRWAEKAIKAAAKGDTAQAAEFARYRLINSYMYSEGKKLAEKIEKTRKHLLDYGKKAKQVRLFAAGKEYADQMNGLLDDYQFRNESKKGENKRATRAVWLQAQMAGLDPFAAYADPTKSPQEQAMAAAEMIERSAVLGRLAEGVDARNYKSITVEEMLAVRDEADLIYKLATLKDRLLKVGERRRMSLLAGDIVASVSANQPKVLPPEPLESNLRGEKIKRAISGFMVSHRTFQALARQFDGGKDGGVFWRLIVRPLNDAFARKTVLMKQVGKDVEKLFSPFSSAELGRFMRDRQTITLNAADGSSTRVTLTTQGRLAVAMNAGNEKNLARLMDSNGWDRLQVQAIIDTLSKREMDFVQATWDYLETWFAEANRVHEAVHGVPMDKQEPLQLATRHGIYAGGYFPIAFDPNRSSKSGQRKLEADAQATGAGRVGVRNEPGFAKKRVSGKVTLPLNLDPFAVILRHLDQVTTSIATEEVLFDVGRLIKLPEVENVIVERHGRVKYDEIIEAIKAAKFGLPVAQGAVEKILNHVRNGSTVAKLGWSVSTAMLQPSGISNSIVRIGFPWMMRGYGRMLGTAAQREGWAKWAMERSEFMRNRRESQSPEQVNLLATLKGNKPLVMIQRSAFQLMAQVQYFSVDLATWYGAFDKATAGGADEALAVSMADQAVLDAQGGGEAFQTAGIQRGSVGVRLLTNLMSYMLTTYQLSVQSVATKDPNLLTKIARISADMVLLWSVPVAATMAIRYAIAAAIGGGDDDDDEEYWSLENISREQASFLMSPFFGLSQVAGAVKMDPYEYRGPAGLDMLVQSYKAMDAASHGDTDQLLRPLNQMVGMAFHLPANQIDKTVRGSLALWNGETDSPLAIFFGPPPK